MAPAEFMESLSKAANENERSNKMIQMILAAADYDKFAALLRIKAKLAHAKTLTEGKDGEEDESEEDETKGADCDDSAFYQGGDDEDDWGAEEKQGDSRVGDEAKGTSSESKDSHK